MRASKLVFILVIGLAPKSKAGSIYSPAESPAIVPGKSFAFNQIRFELKPMELSPESGAVQKAKALMRNGIQIQMDKAAEALVPIQCGVGIMKIAGVEIARIDVHQIYCVWLPNGDLVAGHGVVIFGEIDMVVIEISERFPKRRPANRTIGN